MPTDILLFDIPTAVSRPNSPNTWRVRLALNYKRLNYRTQWVHVSAIEATCKPLGILPTGVKPNGQPLYTLPAIIDRTDASNPVILSNSIPIIEYLESAYPSAPGAELFPGGTKAFQILVVQFVAIKLLTFVSKLGMGAMYRSKPASEQPSLRAKIEARFGKPLEEVEAKGAEREAAWKELEQTMKFVQDAFERNDSGVFLMGRQVSCADFALFGSLFFFKEI
ncbi:hypothetical protein M413DRAFT_443580, partial [Hebeloma cylindrosporum]